MKEVVSKDKAVSPIIATILLIAITVVLAATLISILSSFTNSTHIEDINSSLSLSPAMKTATGTSYDLNITSTSTSPPLSQITIEIFNGSKVLYDGPIKNGLTGSVTFNLGTNTTFKAGDVIEISIQGKELISTVDLIYASTEFSTVTPL